MPPSHDGAATRVTMLLYSDITYDNRVLREARTLVDDGHEVTIVTPYPARRPLPEVSEALRVAVRTPGDAHALPGGEKPRGGGPVASMGWALDYWRGLRRWGAAARKEFASTDVWHAHDLTALIAVAAGPPFPPRVIYDSHELYLESGALGRLPGPIRRTLAVHEGRLARRASAVITVNASVGAELHRRYRVSPVVVMNCPPRPVDGITPEPPRPGPLRQRFGLGDRPVAVFHGGLSPHKGIEVFLGALDRLPRELALVIIGEGQLLPDIERQAALADLHERVFVHPMIEPDDLRAWLADADIGIVLLEPDRLNHILATPNRITEYLNAAVPILAADLPELRRIIEATDAGTLCDPASPASIADGVTRLLDPAAGLRMRHNGLAAARGTYNWETQAGFLRSIYRQVLGGA